MLEHMHSAAVNSAIQNKGTELLCAVHLYYKTTAHASTRYILHVIYYKQCEQLTDKVYHIELELKRLTSSVSGI
jgi:hypothetical protein